jgi:hypothetical protein
VVLQTRSTVGTIKLLTQARGKQFSAVSQLAASRVVWMDRHAGTHLAK